MIKLQCGEFTNDKYLNLLQNENVKSEYMQKFAPVE